MKKLVSLFLALTLAFSLAVPAAAADETATGTTLRLEETEGTVTVKTSAGKGKSVVKGMRLYNGYTIETGASSSAFVSLDEAKAIKLGASGKVEIKKSGKQLEIYLTSGELFFNVSEKLAPDATMNIRTSTMVTGMRGTSGAITPKLAKAFDGVLGLTIYGGVDNKGNELPPIDLDLVAGSKLDTEKIMEAARQAAAEQAPQEEVQQKMEEAAQPKPLEKQDFTPNVVKELANNPQLAERVAGALENAGSDLKVGELVEDLPNLQAAEAKAEQEAQQQVNEAQQQQQQGIESTAAAEKAAGVSTDVNFQSSNQTSGSDRDSSSGGGGGGSSVTRYAVRVVSDLSHCTTDAKNSYTVASSESFSFIVKKDDGYTDVIGSPVFCKTGTDDPLPVQPAIAVEDLNDSEVRFTVSGITENCDLVLAIVGLYPVNDPAITSFGQIAEQLAAHDNILLTLTPNDTSRNVWVPSDSSFTVEDEQLLYFDEGAIELPQNGSIVVEGDLLLAPLASILGAGTLTVTNQGGILNAGTVAVNSLIVDEDSFFDNDVAQIEHAGQMVDRIGQVSCNLVQVAGEFYNEGAINVGTDNTSGELLIATDGTLENDGAITVSASGRFVNYGTFENNKDFTNNGEVQNDKDIVNKGTITNKAVFNNGTAGASTSEAVIDNTDTNAKIINSANATFNNYGKILN